MVPAVQSLVRPVRPLTAPLLVSEASSLENRPGAGPINVKAALGLIARAALSFAEKEAGPLLKVSSYMHEAFSGFEEAALCAL